MLWKRWKTQQTFGNLKSRQITTEMLQIPTGTEDADWELSGETKAKAIN